MSLILSIISMFIVFLIINLLGKVDKEVCFKMLNKEKGVLALLILFYMSDIKEQVIIGFIIIY